MAVFSYLLTVETSVSLLAFAYCFITVPFARSIIFAGKQSTLVVNHLQAAIIFGRIINSCITIKVTIIVSLKLFLASIPSSMKIEHLAPISLRSFVHHALPSN